MDSYSYQHRSRLQGRYLRAQDLDELEAKISRSTGKLEDLRGGDPGGEPSP